MMLKVEGGVVRPDFRMRV